MKVTVSALTKETLFLISCWNINGLEYRNLGVKCNKLHDGEVIETLKRSDCVGLIETHAHQSTDISLPGYIVFRKDRPKHKKAWKSSGGIAVLIKESIRNMFKFDPISDTDIIWVRIQKCYTKLLCAFMLHSYTCHQVTLLTGKFTVRKLCRN